MVNLDPAAEYFDYQPVVDIRELIHVQDTMEDEDLHFGPNGGLIFCIEYLLENADWLHDKIGIITCIWFYLFKVYCYYKECLFISMNVGKNKRILVCFLKF